ncbi:MAG: DNA-processing protein DprA [Anaerolineales bacterium]|nr:DNA-processing protein DprA [Anaerolineales bacterium]MCB8954143.1 DNA-protecting protein DprA [Ardenticatenales bacterium]
MSDLKYWLGFNLVKGIGPAKLQALLSYFADVEQAWQASEPDLRRLGLDQRAIANLVEARRTLDLDERLRMVGDAGISLLTWADPAYPRYLREIPDAPPLFYTRGRINEVDQWAVAVVGTRRLTAYGRQVTQTLVEGLVRNGVTIVSGLARGIDSIAHQTALEMGGRTIAVLGSGLDCIYPPENRPLAARIPQDDHGVVMTEYALGVQPEARNFPPRNRVISGLSLGTLVIEAGERSGALITADFAVEQNRDVFAVPGNINSPVSKGPNRLIQNGAKLVTGVEDILEELNINMVSERVAVQMALPETAEEAALLSLLSPQPTHIDDLARQAGLPSALVSSTLTLMELKGMTRQVGGMNYVSFRESGPDYQV